MNNQPSVAIVILNYNGKTFLEKFLQQVIDSTYENKRVIVADNLSTDDSVIFLRTHFPQVEIILNKENYGFAEGYNQALKHIAANYYVLLNSDVEVTPRWIEPVIELMERDNKIAACQPKILSYTDRIKFEYAGAAGGMLDHLGYPFARGRIFEVIETDVGQYDDNIEVFWASGCAMFLKAKIFHELGGLYAAFFAHQEEIDFCWRAQRAGYKIMYCGESVVYHIGGGTLPKGQYRKTYLNFRNNLILLARNLHNKEKYWKLFIRLILDGVFAIKTLLEGDFESIKAVFFAHMHFYKWLLSHEKDGIKNKKKFSKLSGGINKSIVFEHFIRGKRFFSEIKKE